MGANIMPTVTVLPRESSRNDNSKNSEEEIFDPQGESTEIPEIPEISDNPEAVANPDNPEEVFNPEDLFT